MGNKLILVTGANGFVGRAIGSEMLARKNVVRGVVRSFDSVSSPAGGEFVYLAVSDIGAFTDWSAVLKGVDCVIHCAARAHVMNETEDDALAAYRSVNVAGTKRLAEQAAEIGMRRLIYLSSIKVNGEQTTLVDRYTPMDAPAPEDPYGISKWEAEQALHEISARTGLEVVIIRPPLVYGPGVKGNLGRLLELVCGGFPLPLGAVENRRSLIGLDNLVDLLICCIDHPRAAGQTFLVSDGEDLSTPNLLRFMANAMGKSARFIPLPVPLLQLAGRLVGRSNEVDRLVGSLRIDSSHTGEVLDWEPPVSVEEGIRRMVHGG